MSDDTNAGGWPDAELEARIFMATGVKAEGANRLLVYRIAKLVRAREAAAALAMREMAAALIECGCKNRNEVVMQRPNSAARWSLCEHPNCMMIEAAAIRALSLPDAAQGALDAVVAKAEIEGAANAMTQLQKARPDVAALLSGDAVAGEVRCEAEAERDEFFNRLGRITSELGLPMDSTAGRIIEAIRDAVDDEREACASVSVKVEVPDGAESWSPLEAWEEALLALDEAFRAAIRARGEAE